MATNKINNGNILRETHTVMTQPLMPTDKKYMGQKVNSEVVESFPPNSGLIVDTINSPPDGVRLQTYH